QRIRTNCCAYFPGKGRRSMSKERASDLARTCTELLRKEEDFPTVWDTLLKGHTLVEGIPRQRHDGMRSLLEIPPITGSSFADPTRRQVCQPRQRATIPRKIGRTPGELRAARIRNRPERQDQGEMVCRSRIGDRSTLRAPRRRRL